MSLIHDALKRAGEAGQGRRPSLPSPLSPVRPERSGRGSGAIKWVGLMVVVCFVVAAWYLWRDGKAVGEPEGGESRLVSAGQLSAPVKAAPQPVTGGPVKQVSPKPPEPLQVDLPEEVEPAPAVVAAEPLTLPSQIRVSTNLITRSAVGEQTDGGTEAGGSVEENASWPELRLQSIIFRSEAPMAMISGKTLVAGEKVLGVELLEVRRSSVLLRWQGRTQEMRLPDL